MSKQKNVKTGVYINKQYDNDNNISFNFYTNLRATDKVKFINEVTDLVVTDNYYDVIRNIIFDFVIIDIFTDVDALDVNDTPDLLDRIEEFLENTNIVQIVKANMEDGLLDELNNAVDKNIEYRTGIHINPMYDSLNKLLKTVENKVSNIDTEGMMDIVNKLSGISNNLTVEKLIDAYSNTTVLKKHDEQQV